jgi:hypothetical protein
MYKFTCKHIPEKQGHARQPFSSTTVQGQFSNSILSIDTQYFGMPGLFNGTFIVLWDDEVCNRKVYNIGRKNLKIPESVNQRRTDNTMAKRRTNNTMAKRRTNNTMAKRKRTNNTMAKRKMTNNTMAKRRSTNNTMAKRRSTNNTMAKRKMTNNDLPNTTH